MTTPASVIPAFIDALVAVANTAFGAASLVEVFDGPSRAVTDDTGQQLWVGGSDKPDDEEAAVGGQIWPYASGVFRRESTAVHCLAVAWNGDDDFKTVRDLAFAQVQAFTAAMVADATLGNVLLDMEEPITNIVFSQVRLTTGVMVRVRFDVNGRQQFQN